jgi:hypothetical protein
MMEDSGATGDPFYLSNVDAWGKRVPLKLDYCFHEKAWHMVSRLTAFVITLRCQHHWHECAVLNLIKLLRYIPYQEEYL